ncbi:SusC/RagA family TonB-linked outer membrane protein [Alistipes sp. OttesenSCG-928-B03]|nr:SusC/RagA family TonB-linked outer membrane protein [Alistipes sp. OttesenSCG-928-B03]
MKMHGNFYKMKKVSTRTSHRHRNVIIWCLIVLFSSISPEAAAAQRINISVRNTPVESVFELIANQSGYDFVYSNDYLRGMQPVSVQMEGATVSTVMDAVLSGTKLGYVIRDNMVIISPREQQPEQQVTVTGRVTDEAGNPLPGANVMLTKTHHGTSTDNNGNFSLRIPVQVGAVLSVSYIGMLPVEVEVGDRTHFEVTMHANAIVAEDVIVTGYYTLSRERSAGSYSRVEGSDLQMKTGGGIVERLAGLLPGFTYNPVGDDKFLVRGANSINSNREPLFVVDGIPTTLSTIEETLSADDILSVTALKDATASSIWGAAAGNGVIVITTVRGQLNKPMSLKYSGSVQIQGKPDFDYLDYMNASEYVDFALGIIDPDMNYNTEVLDRYGIISPIERIYNDAKTGAISSTQAAEAYDKLRKVDNVAQVKEHLYRMKTVHQHNLSLSGGSDKNSYFFSLNYRNSRPQEINHNDNRIIFNAKNDYRIFPWMKFSLSTNVTFKEASSKYTPDVVGMIPYESLVDEGGNPSSQFHMFYSDEAAAWMSEQLNSRNMATYDFRMLDELDKQSNKSSALSARVQAGITLNLFEGLEFESMFYYQSGSGKSETIDKAGSFRVLDLRTQQTSIKEGSTSRIPQGAILNKTWSRSHEWVARNQFNYNNTFCHKHHVSALLGTESRKVKTETDNYVRYGYNESSKHYVYVDEASLKLAQAGGTITDPLSTDASMVNFLGSFGNGIKMSELPYFSLYANAAYDFDSRYGVNASVRVDQSNTFGTGIRWKPIWSAGLIWNISNEAFFNVGWVDRLALRVSRGIAGNAPNSGIGGPFDIITRMSVPDLFYKEIPNGMVVVSSPANRNLKWEKTTITNIGVDYSLLGGRIAGSIEWYDKTTNDLLAAQSIDPTNGFAEIYTNIGKLRNRGIDLSIRSLNIATRDFSWSTTLNFSYNKGKVLDIYVPETINDYLSTYRPVFIQGYDTYGIFSYRYAGLDDRGEPMVYDENGEKTATSISNVDELVYSGTAQPPYSGGFRNMFRYRNLTLDVQIVYNLGHKIRKPVTSQNSNGRVLYNQTLGNQSPWINPISKQYASAWRQPGDEDSTDVPRWLPASDSRQTHSFWLAADKNVISGSYIHVSDITLTYSLPRKFAARIGMRDCSISAQVANPFIWWANDDDVDPRYVSHMIGVDRTLKYGPEYMLKLNIQF